jgi:hypothetical protein
MEMDPVEADTPGMVAALGTAIISIGLVAHDP